MSSTRSIVGAWDLLKYELILPGHPIQPLWTRLRGRLIYTAYGTVSVVIARTTEAPLENAEVIAYSGTYEVQGEEVAHHIYVSNLAHYRDKTVIRLISWNDAFLVLTTPALIHRKIHQVTWQVLPNPSSELQRAAPRTRC